MNTDFEGYISPFSWRYGSTEMRQIWSEVNKRRLWRQIWLSLAEVQAEFGLVHAEQVRALEAHVNDVDMKRALEIEDNIHHDLMAELMVFAEQAPQGGGILHMGATSMDIEDNADALRICKSLDLLLSNLGSLLTLFAQKMHKWANLPLIAFTHLQPAEPSTLGYRLAIYAQDLLADWDALQHVRKQVRGKGFKGAVGTGASFGELIGIENLADFEAYLSKRLGLDFYPVTTQTYPRKQEYQVISALAGLGGTLYKFAFDLRVLQSPPIGELAEPFGSTQVGSSAMPFKRNPIVAEKINSLARALAQMPRLAWDNAAHSLLERTLDDSANRRSMLPEVFLSADELLGAAMRILQGLNVDEIALARNLSVYGPFAGTERVLMALAKRGADRQEMHARLRNHTLVAWSDVKEGQPNPLVDLVVKDKDFCEYLSPEELLALMDARQYVGDAPRRALEMARTIENTLGDQPSD
jgi:adenylosuccinate lyase